jgi:hypothetical protein
MEGEPTSRRRLAQSTLLASLSSGLIARETLPGCTTLVKDRAHRRSKARAVRRHDPLAAAGDPRGCRLAMPRATTSPPPHAATHAAAALPAVTRAQPQSPAHRGHSLSHAWSARAPLCTGASSRASARARASHPRPPRGADTLARTEGAAHRVSRRPAARGAHLRMPRRRASRRAGPAMANHRRPARSPRGATRSCGLRLRLRRESTGAATGYVRARALRASGEGDEPKRQRGPGLAVARSGEDPERLVEIVAARSALGGERRWLGR